MFPNFDQSFPYDEPIAVTGYPGGRENYEAGFPLKEMFKSVPAEKWIEAYKTHLIVYPPEIQT